MTRRVTLSHTEGMDAGVDLFARFGGIRPMGRKLGIDFSTVAGWKRARRVPAEHQPLILRRAEELGLGVTAEDVIFPFPEDRGTR